MFVGTEGTLVLTTQVNRPQGVRCMNQSPATRPWSSACKTILDTMQADTSTRTFAVAGEQGDVKVPLTLTERKIFRNAALRNVALRNVAGRASFTDLIVATGQCIVVVDATVLSDQASWYDIWLAAVSADGMCARQGRSGLSRFIGKWGYLKASKINRAIGRSRKLTVQVKK